MSYLLSTDAWLYIMTSDSAYPAKSDGPSKGLAEVATRKWAEDVDMNLVHISIITYGEILVIHRASRSNLALQYELKSAIDSLETSSGEELILNLTSEDMSHWASIYGSLDANSDLALEDSFVLAQALCQGFTYVGQRTDVIDTIEGIGLNFLDPEEWQSAQSSK